MDRERYEWCPKAKGIIMSMLAKDSHPRAYIFLLCNEKVRPIVVRGTTRTKRDENDEKYNLHQQNGIKRYLSKQQGLIRQTQFQRLTTMEQSKRYLSKQQGLTRQTPLQGMITVL
jgi:hypothetical protein